MIKAVIIDMDNTLIDTEVLYDVANEKTAQYIAEVTGCSAKDALDVILARQIALFPTMAYDPELVPLGNEQALLHFNPGASDAEISAARDLAALVYDAPAVLKPGAAAAVAAIAQHYDVYLLTAGAAWMQQKRIDILPFKNTFRDIFIVLEKTTATYEDTVRRLQLQPEECVMIGDSLRSDVIPAVEAGLHAIFVPAHNWSPEVAGMQLPLKAAACENLAAAAKRLAPVSPIAPIRKPPAPKR